MPVFFLPTMIETVCCKHLKPRLVLCFLLNRKSLNFAAWAFLNSNSAKKLSQNAKIKALLFSISNFQWAVRFCSHIHNMAWFSGISSKPHHFMASSAGIGPATHSLEGYCSIHWTTRMKPWLLPLIWSPFEGCNGRCPKMVDIMGIEPKTRGSLNV